MPEYICHILLYNLLLLYIYSFRIIWVSFATLSPFSCFFISHSNASLVYWKCIKVSIWILLLYGIRTHVKLNVPWVTGPGLGTSINLNFLFALLAVFEQRMWKSTGSPGPLCSHTQYQPQHEISNNVVCATSKASDQPAHMHSLIRAFACRFNILWVLSYCLDRIWSFGCTGSPESTLVKIPNCWK